MACGGLKPYSVIAAHPDDIESWAAGSVAVLVRQGWRAVYVLCTSGEHGTDDPAEDPARVAARREREQEAAGGRIGAGPPGVRRLPGGGVGEDGAVRGGHWLE